MSGNSEIGIDESHRQVLAIISADDTRLGDVYRLNEEGKSPAQIADALGVDTSGFVSNYKTMIAALVNGVVPASTSLCSQIASRVRRWLTRTDLQDSTRRYLEALHTELQLRADDSMAKAVEDERAVQKTQLVESSDTPGIYVYTLPHYLRYPFESESGRTLLKVGRSERDTFQRVNGQTRITALPEDPVLLRVYQVDPGTSSKIERDFHSWLDDANHDRSRSTRGGTEWFLTSVRFLDRIARSHKLVITVVNDVEMGEL